MKTEETNEYSHKRICMSIQHNLRTVHTNMHALCVHCTWRL